MGKTSILLLACVLGAGALAGCTSYSSFPTVASADWRPGYSFAYSLSSHQEVSGHALRNGEQDPRQEFRPAEDQGPVPAVAYTVFNTHTNVAGTDYYLAMGQTTGPSYPQHLPSGWHLDAQPGVVAFSQSDLAPHYTAVNGFFQGCGACPQQEPTLMVAPGSNGDAPLRFPLTNGDSWSDASSSLAKGMSYTTSVRGLHSVAGPNGPVDAVRISHVAKVDSEAIRAQALAEAKREGIEVESFTFEVSGTRDVDYAPSLHNIVVDSTSLVSHIAAVFRQNGTSFDYEVLAVESSTLTLTAATLTETAESTLAEALGGKVATPLPNGGILGITGLPESVNAAESPTLSLGVAGADNATSLRWTLRTYDGALADSGTGKTFQTVIREPSQYTVTLDATLDGTSHRVQKTLAANWVASTPASCPVVAFEGGPGCDTLDLPVRPGISALTVTAQRAGLAGEPGFGFLRVDTPSGPEEAAMQGNAATVHIDGPSLGGGLGTWTAQFRPTAGVQEQVSYRVELLYSPAPGPVVMPAWMHLA